MVGESNLQGSTAASEGRAGQVDSLWRHFKREAQVLHLAKRHDHRHVSLVHNIEVRPGWWLRWKLYTTCLMGIGLFTIGEGELS